MTDVSLAALLGMPASALTGGALAWYLARGGRADASGATAAPPEGDRGEAQPPAAPRSGVIAAPEPPPASAASADLAFHRLVAENVSDVLMRLDCNWTRVFVSPACLDVFGYGVDEILSRPALDLVHPEDRDKLRRTLAALGAAEPVRDATWRGLHRDGRIVWIEARYRHIPEDGGAVAILRDVTGRRQAEERLRDAMGRLDRLPMADPVTGLPSEAAFRATVERLLAEDLGLHVLRIGQAWSDDGTGATLARDMAQRLGAACFRDPAIAGFGTAGFAIAMRPMEGDQGIAARVRDLLRLLGEPRHLDGQTLEAAISIGIAASPRDGAHTGDLLEAATLALDRARAAGPGSYRFYEPEMGAAEARKRALRDALPMAIAAGQIVPWYQPIVRLTGGAVWGFEVLARWAHPEHGLLEPAAFVPLAEEIGAAGALLRVVLRQACATAGAWPAEAGLSVNLSEHDIQDTALPSDLAAILAETGFDGTRLEMEIREEGVDLDSRAAQTTMEGLRVLGVSLALDDFGTGHTDLCLLRALPLDKVKIDGSLVRPLARGSESNRFFRAVVQLSHAMGLEVVAKGIEAEATLETARVLGCTYGQGDWIRPPAPAADLSPVLLGSRD